MPALNERKDTEMKTLKPTKRHGMARSRKSGSAAIRVIDGDRSASGSNARLRQSRAVRPAASRPKIEGERKNLFSPRLDRQKADPQFRTAVKNFEMGVRAFRRQNYEKAAEIFAKLVGSEVRDVAERAHMHLRLCRERTSRSKPVLKSAEDYYALGVACLNAREYGLAIEHLSKADKLKAQQDHVHYALAVSHALGGNRDAAFAHLERAFALRSENRIHARRDQDFQGLAADPRFRRLLYPAES